MQCFRSIELGSQSLRPCNVAHAACSSPRYAHNMLYFGILHKAMRLNPFATISTGVSGIVMDKALLAVQ